jgi:hypothetical protein
LTPELLAGLRSQSTTPMATWPNSAALWYKLSRKLEAQLAALQRRQLAGSK